MTRRIAYRPLCAAAIVGVATAGARAQTTNPVYVDDSPRAAELLHLARAQAAENTGEAVRLYQELLDDYGRKLVPWRPGISNHLADVRRLVLDDLLADPALLERYAIAQSGEAARMLEAGDLERLAMTRPLTEAGLDTLLRLAQESMEAARFHGAISLLEEALAHPALDDEGAAAAWLMLGTCAHFLGDESRAEQASQHLDTIDRARPSAGELARIRTGDAGADAVRGITVLDGADAREQQELVAQEIWLAPLDDSLLRRRYPDRPGSPRSPGYETRNRRAELTTAAPTAAGPAIYVNEGHVIRALDRYTGRPLWPAPYADRSQTSIGDRDADATGDLSIVTVEGDWLVTLTGYAQDRQRTDDGKVLCLSASTGRPRWALPLHRIIDDDEYEGLFAHGQPLIVEGRVIVVARKISRQSVTGCYVIALDLATGELDWIRHVASSGGRHRTGRPFSSPTLHEGDVLVSTAVGAIACLDARTGAMRWLRRDTVPVHDGSRDRRPWEMRTLVARDDRVIALSPDDDRVVAIDRHTGEQIASHEATSVSGWNRPAYLLGGEDFVYGIGDTIRAFDPAALDFPVWQLPAPEQSGENGVAIGGAELRIAGRVQVAGGLLIVPTERAVLAIDAQTGRIVHELDVGTGGNPVATDGQLILATGDEIDAYMSFSRAVAMLRERVTDDPADPEPAISLVQLATRVGDLDLVMQASRLALTAIDRPENRDIAARRVDARRELFETLLADEATRLAITDDTGEAFYGLIAAVANGPEEQTEHLLAYADWLAERRPGAAAEPLQRILDDAMLRSTVRTERDGSVLRTAGAWACARLARLVRDHGAARYAALAETARLQRAGVGPGDDRGERLMDIALAFPLAPAGLVSAIEAAEIAHAHGDTREALARLLRAYQAVPSRDRAIALLGHFVDTCIDDDRLGAARSALEAVIAQHGNVPLETPTGRRSAQEWYDGLAGRPVGLARIGAPADEPEERHLSGRLVPVDPDARVPPDLVVLMEDDPDERENRIVRLLGGLALTERWTTAVRGDALTLLDLTPREVVLFAPEPADPRVLALDRTTGEPLWSTPFLEDQLVMPIAAERSEDKRPDGTPFLPNETVCARGHTSWFLVHRSGGVAAFDRSNGRVVQWSRDRTIDQVHHVISHPLGLVLIGAERRAQSDDGTPELAPRILVLDPRTGDVVQRLRPNTSTGVLWACVDGLGGLACASAEGIELIDILTGSRRWTNVAFALGDTNRGWRIGDRMLVETRTSSLVSLSDESGETGRPFDTAVRGDWDPLQVEEVVSSGDRLFVRYRQRVVRYDRTGRVLGADVIDRERNYLSLLPAQEGIVVVSLANTAQRSPRRSQIERTYELHRLSDSCAAEHRPVGLPARPIAVQNARLVDGWVLLSTSDSTIAVPMPPES